MKRSSTGNVYLRDCASGRGTVLGLRFIELFVFFVVVFVSQILAGFSYRSDAMLFVFMLSAFLQYNADWFWEFIGNRRDWSDSKITSAILLYSSYIDIGTVTGLIYLTGTIESPFLLLIAVPLFFAGNVFHWKTTIKGFFPAAVLAMASLALLEIRGVIPHNACYSFESQVYMDTHFTVGMLLVIGAVVGLVLFLSAVFQDRTSSALEKLRRKGFESDSRIHELSRLYDISLGINSAISMETLLKIVAKEATLLLGYPWAGVVLFNNKKEISHSVVLGSGRDPWTGADKKIRRGGLTEWIWAHNAPLVIEDTLKETRADCSKFLKTSGINAVIGFPLTAGKNVLGVVYAGDYKPRRLQKDQLRLLTTLGAQLSTAIEKSKLHESLENKIRVLESNIESLEKANNLKLDFVSHVSHELRTPLTSIKAYVETLNSNISDPNFNKSEEFLGIVSKETERLIRVVNDILDVSKIEFGQRPLQRSYFAISDVVDDVVSMLSPALAEQKVAVDVNIPKDLPKVDADFDLMKQIFINLIGNAAKYSQEGSVVNISAREEAVDIHVTVEDQGIGIPQEEVHRIFDKYFRATSSGSGKLEGMGLGLAIVKNIVEQHGGTIKAESEEGVGSKFIITIPREHCFNDLIGYIAEVVDAKEQLHEMLELIVKMIAEMLSVKVVSLMLLDKTRSELFIKMSFGLDEWVVENVRVKIGEGIAGKVAEAAEPLLIHNIEENEIYSCPNNPQYDTVSLLSVPLLVNGVVVGVINVNNKTTGKPFDRNDLSLLVSFSERISRALERVRAVEDSQSYLEDTIEAFRRMLETQSKAKTIEAIMALTVKVSRKLGLSEKEISVMQYVASVHDIGMTEISDDILNKALHLTEEEVQRIRRHPQRGAELIRPLEFVESVSNIILYHHERVDGSGYPMGLKGKDIPIGARVLSVIDAFQSMTSGRPYKKAYTVEKAALELVEFSGRQFDKEIVSVFLSVLKEEGKLSGEQARKLTQKLEGAVPSGT